MLVTAWFFALSLSCAAAWTSPMRNTGMFPVPVTLDGEVPAGLDGTLFRNVPSVYELAAGEYGAPSSEPFHRLSHMFDALPSIVALNFSAGRVTFRRKILRTKLVQNVEEHGLYNTVPLGSSSHWWSLARAVLTGAGLEWNNPITNLIFVNQSYAATNDVARAWEQFDADLETLVGAKPPHVLSSGLAEFAASHPGYDPIDRKWFNYVGPLSPSGMGPPISPPYRYRLYSMDEDTARVSPLAEFETSSRSMCHQLGVTPESVVWVETPYTTSLVPTTVRRGFTIFNMIKVERRSPVFHVFDRVRGGALVAYHVDPTAPARANEFYNGHIVNTFEDEEGREGSELSAAVLVVDVVAYDLADDAFGYDISSIASGAMAVTFRNTRLKRCDLSRGSFSFNCETLVNVPFEYPALLPKDEMHDYQFVWGVSISPDAVYWDEVIKLDTKNRVVVARWSHPGILVNEPRIAPYGNKKAAVLLLANDPENDKSFLVVLDSVNLSLLAMLELPTVVPFHPHGVFVENGYGKRPGARGFRN